MHWEDIFWTLLRSDSLVSFSGMIYTGIVSTKQFSNCFTIILSEILGVLCVSAFN